MKKVKDLDHLRYLVETELALGDFREKEETLCVSATLLGEYMKTPYKDVEKWLEVCPQPVIGRVITSVQDLDWIGISRHVYQDGTLAVTDINSLRDLSRGIENDHWCWYTFHVQKKCSYEYYQVKALSEKSAKDLTLKVYPKATRIKIINIQPIYGNEKPFSVQELLVSENRRE